MTATKSDRKLTLSGLGRIVSTIRAQGKVVHFTKNISIIARTLRVHVFNEGHRRHYVLTVNDLNPREFDVSYSKESNSVIVSKQHKTIIEDVSMTYDISI